MDNRMIGVSSTVVPCDAKGRNRTVFFANMAKQARTRGVQLVLFSPDHVDYRNHRVRGYVAHSSMSDNITWKYETVRMPNVIYENMYVHLVMKGMARPLRRYATLHHIPIFNPLLPGKWTMSQWVTAHPELGLRVPNTRAVKRVTDVTDLLDAVGTVYLKPTGGYGGRGVFRLRSAGHQMVAIDCDRFGDHGAFHRRLNRAELLRFLRPLTERRSHVVQEQIPLLELQGGKVDFRVVVQRNGSGKWQLVGIVPKIAAEDGVVTNLVAGGRRISLSELQTRIRAQELPIKALEQTAIQLSEFLTKKFPTLGIIGYDLGVDRTGQVWFIEANPKPARRLLFRSMDQLAADLALDFAVYLGKNG